ncbi:MAG: dephospho-CoA kinase [Sphaerochaetaceae bacterium]
MKVIGLTGRYNSGKNYIASLLEQKGATLIDVDTYGYEARESAKERLVEAFGSEVLTSTAEIDRSFLREIVFSDSKNLKVLESIVHPQMVKMVQKQIKEHKQRGTKALVINAALLQRMNLHKECDAIIYLYAPCFGRLFRAIKRDSISCSSFVRIEKAQKDITKKGLKGTFSVTKVTNWGPKAFIYRQVDKFWASMDA